MSTQTPLGAAGSVVVKNAPSLGEPGLREPQDSATVHEPGSGAASRDSEIRVDSIRKDNLEELRRLLEATLPVRYGPKFYVPLIGLSEQQLAIVAYSNATLVGTICCRVEERPNRSGTFLYIMALAVLPTFRSRGIGSLLLKRVISRAREMHLAGAFLHVWTSNEDAIRFYGRHGFESSETIKGYYRRITPPDGYVLELPLCDQC